MAIVGQTFDPAPLLDLPPPFRQGHRVRTLLVLLEQARHVGQHAAHRADDRNVHPHILGDGRGVHVQVNDGGVGAELLDLAGDAVIEAGADGEEDIRLVHRHVGFVGAVHAEHAQEPRVRHGEGPQPHEGAGDGETRLLDQVAQGLGGLAQDDAAAGVEHRPLGLEQDVHSLLDLPRVPLQRRAVGAHLDVLGVVVGDLDLGVGDILGDIHEHRPRPARRRNVKGLADGQRQVMHILDQVVVLDPGAGDADRVHLLEGVTADHGGRHLPGQDHHGDGVHEGGGDAGDGIGGARARGDQGDATATGGAGVAIRAMGGGLLVTDQDVLDLVLLEQGIVGMQDGAPGIPEDILHALIDQRLNDDLGSTQFQFN